MIAAAPFEGDGADFCAGLPFEEGSPTGGGAFFVQPVLLLAALLASSEFELETHPDCASRRVSSMMEAA